MGTAPHSIRTSYCAPYYLYLCRWDSTSVSVPVHSRSGGIRLPRASPEFSAGLTMILWSPSSEIPRRAPFSPVPDAEHFSMCKALWHEATLLAFPQTSVSTSAAAVRRCPSVP